MQVFIIVSFIHIFLPKLSMSFSSMYFLYLTYLILLDLNILIIFEYLKIFENYGDPQYTTAISLLLLHLS
jgi:hypothetical protein